MKNTDDRRICYGYKSLVRSLLVYMFFGPFFWITGSMTLMESIVFTICIIFFHLIVFFNVICVDDEYIKVKGVLPMLSSKSVIEVSKISKVVFSLFLTSKLTTESMKVYDKEGNFITSIPMTLSYKERRLLIEQLKRLDIEVEL